MKFLLSIFLCASLTLLASARSFPSVDETNVSNEQSNPEVPSVLFSLMTVFKSEFTNYKKAHNKIYTSPEEENSRFSNFVLSYIKVSDHNALYDEGKNSYKMAINHMSDWSADELNHLNGFKLSNTTGSMYLSPSLNIELPESIDWREKGAVTPVKNQDHCGSCYTFSTTGSLEGQIWRKTGKLISLSEQQIVDCDDYDNGCHGGFMARAFNYIKETGGLETEGNYPYVSGRTRKPNDKCNFNKKQAVVTDTGFVQLPAGDEEKLKEAVATVGPISIAFSAPESLLHYTEGIFHDDKCANIRINHAVLLVGYGTEEATRTPYWIIKNSWGPNWGDKGYFKLKRDVNSCNMANYSLYPLV